MSIKTISLAILLFVGSIMLAYMIQLQFNGSPFDSSLQAAKRQPGAYDSVHLNSIKHEKLRAINSVPHSHNTEKLRGPVALSIEAVNPGPKPAGQVFRLKFIVESSVDLDFIDFKVSVPPGVELLSGSDTGQMVNLEADVAQFVELDFRSLSDQNEQIHISITKEDGGTQFGEVVQFNTIFEEQLNANKQKQLEGSTEEEADSLFKVFE